MSASPGQRPRDRDAQGRPEQARPRDRAGRPLAYDTAESALTEEWEYDTVEQALATGVWLWDQERFFEAHECLEDVWHAAPTADRDFWQGVIQIAVGCVHHQRGNAAGVRAILTKARARLVGYPDVHHGVDVESLVTFADGVVAVVDELARHEDASDGAEPQDRVPTGTGGVGGEHRRHSSNVSDGAEPQDHVPTGTGGVGGEHRRHSSNLGLAEIARVEIGYPRFPAMDDGPWFDHDVAPHPLDRTPAWTQPPEGREEDGQ